MKRISEMKELESEPDRMSSSGESLPHVINMARMLEERAAAVEEFEDAARFRNHRTRLTKAWGAWSVEARALNDAAYRSMLLVLIEACLGLENEVQAHATGEDLVIFLAYHGYAIPAQLDTPTWNLLVDNDLLIS